MIPNEAAETSDGASYVFKTLKVMLRFDRLFGVIIITFVILKIRQTSATVTTYKHISTIKLQLKMCT